MNVDAMLQAYARNKASAERLETNIQDKADKADAMVARAMVAKDKAIREKEAAERQAADASKAKAIAEEKAERLATNIQDKADKADAMVARATVRVIRFRTSSRRATWRP